MNGNFRIGPWLVEPTLNRISRNGASRHLEPKVMQVLVRLSRAEGQVIPKQELIDDVWKGTFVTDDVLTRSISELRDAFEDNARDPQIIQTIPKRGYRLLTGARPTTTPQQRWLFAYVLLIVVCLMGIALWVMSKFSRGVPNVSSSISRLTTSGKVPLAAISPDGKFLTYTEDAGDKQTLWLQQLASGSRSMLLSPAAAQYSSVRFSSDGNYIYYTRNEGNDLTALYQIPTIGGTPRKLLADVPGPVAVSPDGKSFAYVRPDRPVAVNNPRSGGASPHGDVLVIKATDGPGEKVVTTRKGSVGLSQSAVAWSPDGKLLAVVEFSKASVFQAHIVVVPADGGRDMRITDEGLWRIFRLEWLPDGRGLVAAVAGTHYQLWEFPYPKGQPRRITHDVLRYDEVSLTGDSRALVSVGTDFLSSIWVGDAAKPDRAVPVTTRFGHFVGVKGLTWTPNGKLIYFTNTSDQYDFIVMGADGSDPRRLPLDGYKWFPDVCPDNHTLVYTGVRSGAWTIFRTDLEGGQPQPVTELSTRILYLGGETPHCSPDGKWVVYVGASGMMKVPIGGGAGTRLTDKPCDYPGISPDGAWIACLYHREQGSPELAIVRFGGGPPVKLFDLPTTFVDNCCPFAWTPDGKAVAFVDKRGGAGNVWAQPIRGGPPEQLTHFTTDGVAWFAWSRDGKQIAIARGNATQDAMLITGFR